MDSPFGLNKPLPSVRAPNDTICYSLFDCPPSASATSMLPSIAKSAANRFVSKTCVNLSSTSQYQGCGEICLVGVKLFE